MARQFRVIPASAAKLDSNANVADVVFVGANGKPTDIGSAAVKPATHVALAAGATPTKSEFDALVNSLIAAGLMAAE
jgi:ornithine cyclodeaminase/alanine dehydrogenase-like protein (mu-crystallin family)